MPQRKPKRNEPTERTEKGFEVRIPSRREFFSNLKKLARRGPLKEEIKAPPAPRSEPGDEHRPPPPPAARGF